MSHRRSHQRREDGQILAIFAGALVLLILISGLVIDGGNVFLTRRDSQNSADLGSMAGTKRLADYYVKNQAYTGIDNVYTAIATRMVQNDCSAAVGSICSWTARYVGPRTGIVVPGPRAGRFHRHRTARRRQRAEGARRQGRRDQDAPDLPAGRHGQDAAGPSRRPRPRSPASRRERRPASCCRSQWSPRPR